jgi:hypothetical protein
MKKNKAASRRRLAGSSRAGKSKHESPGLPDESDKNTMSLWKKPEKNLK